MTITNEPATQRKEGRVVTIAGPVVDVEFPSDAIPEINSCLSMNIEVDGKPTEVRAEVAQQIGDNRVRAICLKPTDGLTRGQEVLDTGAPIDRVKQLVVAEDMLTMPDTTFALVCETLKPAPKNEPVPASPTVVADEKDDPGFSWNRIYGE